MGAKLSNQRLPESEQPQRPEARSAPLAGAVAPVVAPGRPLTRESILKLQRTVGNQAVSSLIARATAAPPADPVLPKFDRDQQKKLQAILAKLESRDTSWNEVGFADKQALADFFNQRQDKLDGALFELSKRVDEVNARKGAMAEEQRRGDTSPKKDLGSQRAADAVAEIVAGPELPDRTRLPVTTQPEKGEKWGDAPPEATKGHWEDENARGNCRWFPDDPAMHAISKGEGIPFKNGEPDFSQWVKERAIITGMSGSRSDKEDFKKANRSLARQKGWLDKDGEPDAARAQRYMDAQQLTWHHQTDGETMIAVPSALHNPLPHMGGAAAQREKAAAEGAKGPGEEGGSGGGGSGQGGPPPVAAAVAAAVAPVEQKPPPDLRPAIAAKHEEAYKKLAPILDEIYKLQPGGKKPKRGSTDGRRLEALEKQRADLEPQVEQLQADLEFLDSPGKSEKAMKDLATRYGTGTVASTTSKTELDETATNVTNKRTETETVYEGGEKKGEKKVTTTKGLDLEKGTFSYKKAEEHGEHKGATTSFKVGPEGASAGKQTTTPLASGGGERQTSVTGGIGGGKATVGMGETVSQGQFKEGELVKGTQSSKKQDVSVYASAQGVGAGTSTVRDFTKVHSEGVKTGVTQSADGKFLLSVDEVPGDPPTYDLVLTISLTASVGGKAGAEKGSSAKGSGDGSVKATGAASVKFVHRLSEHDAEQYLAGLGVAAGGAAKGKDPEFAIVAAAVNSGGKASEGLLPDVFAAFGSAEGARQMHEGDAMEYSLSGKGEAELGVGAKGGGFGVGAKGGVSAGASRNMRLAKRDGKLVITKEIATETGASAGLEGSYGAGKMSHEEQRGSTASRSVTFKLDPEDKEFDAQFAAIGNAGTQEEMAALVKRWPKVAEQAVKTGQSASSTTGMGAGPVTLNVREGSAYGETVKTGEQGRAYTYEGSSTRGAGLKVGPLPEFGSGVKDQVTATATSGKGPGGEEVSDVSADISKEHTETSLSAKDLRDKLDRDRIGLLMGGAKLTEDTVTVSGMKLNRADVLAIVAKAENRNAWQHAVKRAALIDEWEDVRVQVLDASDFREVAQQLAAFAGRKGAGRTEAITNLLREAGKGQTGGSLYEFPASLAKHKSTYDDLVMGDPLAEPRKLAAEGKAKSALDEIRKVSEKLAALATALDAERDRFTNVAARGEMLKRTMERQSELQAEAARIGGAGAAGAADPGGQDPARKEAEYQQLVKRCSSFKQDEQQTFAAIAKTYHGTGFFGLAHFSKRPDSRETADNSARMSNLLELYAQWEPDVARMLQLVGELKHSPAEVDALRPDRKRYRRFADEGSIQTSTSVAPE